MGWFGLVVIHELGHAAVVKAVGARPVSIDLTGFGGLCRWDGRVSLISRSAIAWGGVAAQLVLLGAVELGGPRLPTEVFWLGTISNAWMIAINLLPIEPLDGAEAWPLPWLLGIALRKRLSNYRDVRHLEEDPEEFAMKTSRQGAEAKEVAAELLRAAREEEQKR